MPDAAEHAYDLDASNLSISCESEEPISSYFGRGSSLQKRVFETILGHRVYAFLDSNLHGGHGESPHAICLPKRLFASPWGAVGATHQTVLERGTAEHSDRPHRGQASAAKSKSPELGPSGPWWTRCDNRRNFLYNGRNSPTIGLYTGIRETTHFSNRSG